MVIAPIANIISSGNAQSSQKRYANDAIASQQAMLNTSEQALNPFIDAGHAATMQAEQLEGLPTYDANGNPIQGGSNEIQKTLSGLPGYQFAMQQGLKSVQNSAAARGLGISGAAQKGAANYATGLAQQNYGSYLTGIQNTANTGASAANALTGAATQTGNEIGQAYQGIGNAQAAGAISQGNSIASVVPNLLGWNYLYGAQNQQNNAANNSGGLYNNNFDQAAFQQSGLPWSDSRLKKDIKFIKEENGIRLHEFSYLWSSIKYIGVIAQELLNSFPEAVHNIDGYFAVDYSKLGIEFRKA